MTDRLVLTAQELADACADAMWREDNATRHLGMRRGLVAPGVAVISMVIEIRK